MSSSSSFGFSKNSGPGGPHSGPITFGGLNPDFSAAPNPKPRSFEAVVRSPSPSSMPTPRLSSAHSPRLPPAYSPPPPYVASNRSAASFPRGDTQTSSFPTPLGPISSKVSPSQVSQTSTRSPVHYNEDFLNDPINDATEGLEDITVNHYVASQRRQSPFTAAASNDSIINPTASFNKPQRPSFSPPMSSSRFSAISDSQYNQRTSSSAYGVNGDATGIRVPNPSLAERSRSPPVEANVTMLPNNPLNKRTRSPPAATGQVFLRSSPSTENDTEREEQAKAKRLARFKTELDEAEPGVLVQRGPDVPQNKKSSSLKSVENKNSMEDLSMDYDNEDLQSSNIIVGLCPDMCPVSERGERERKGDLDRYERLDGDRNHTSKILAVKKYNRTAEREAELIRPMPILQKTMDYLLGLLDQPYDDSLLGLYNFLWDRMRAIRMDLRMQHIFNLKAITMLEQMIRLHVIAMHELCEFSKGEGFSEGFDAHLNIEQMNKTSVELFQLYDDHRKKGIFIPTEKEFRGYYALLKLDKHPGYKVEPAELSLDLAKMTAEIRQTQEILFARDVARSCRTGNFIAFFRHARKASYLQACLMHAHFSKLRTQALASLHSGLQLKQGLPVTLVAKWLGMEGEDVESLLEYHGFMIKEFEEPYMVKDGPFLHDDKDYPTRCSTLVQRKKSNTIVQDVSSSLEIILSPKPSQFDMFSKKKYATRQLVQTERHLNVSVDGDMEIEAVSSPRGTMQSEPVFEKSSGTQVGLVSGSRFGQASNDHQRVSALSPRSNSRVSKGSGSVRSPGRQEKPSPFTLNNSTLIFSDGQLSDKNIPMTFSTDLSGLAPHTPSLGFPKQDEFRGPFQSSPNSIVHPDPGATPSSLVATDVRELALSDLEVASVRATSPKHGIFMEELAAEKYTDVHEKVEADDVESNFDKEVAEAKLRLLLRLWRRRFVRKKKLQEENRLAANTALSSLSRGPPLWQTKDKPVHSPMLNIDKAMHERHGKLQESRIRWNISDLVASKLAERNANSNCVCWKVISFSWFYHGTYDTRARSFLTYPSLDEWLQYKLFPSFKDETIEGLAMSAPGLSVWRKWSPTDSGDIACYFSVIKDITSGNSATNLVGASAILFPISKMVPHDVQRTQLHNLAMSLPTEASIPVLIICGSRQELDFVAKLGLEELDNSRVGSYSIICLNEGEGADRFHGYFSNQKLKDGLIWLASESRPQPVLSCVTTRELALMQLNSSLYALHPRECDRMGPNQCISAFNDALDQTINNIITASKANPTGWPCPEVFILDKSAVEFRAVKKFLPNLGWSSLGEIEPLISDLRNCKLPYFSGDLSWLSKGCTLEEEIEEQRQLLQNCLSNYLTQTSNVMHLMLAVKEATLMVQKHTRIELRDTEFKMVPSWVLMFKRLFNWQLNSAASFTRKAYVLEQAKLTCNPKFLQSDLDVEIHRFSVHPSLDEMVQVSCSPIVSKRVRSSPNSLRNAVAKTSAVTLSNHVSEEKNYHSEIQIHSVDASDIPTLNSDLNLVTRSEKKDDRLTELLNQCDMLQDEIEKRLSIYF